MAPRPVLAQAGQRRATRAHPEVPVLQVVLLVALAWTVLSIATLAGLSLLVSGGVPRQTGELELVAADGAPAPV